MVISVVTCLKEDFPNMTFAPSTPDTHDFNTTVIYTCDVGYQYSSGDLVRTCDSTGNWSGAVPVCDGKHWSYCFIIFHLWYKPPTFKDKRAKVCCIKLCRFRL